MKDNQPVINRVERVPPGYVFPNQMSRAHQLCIVWEPGPDYQKDGTPSRPGGCLLETPLLAVLDRIEIITHNKYIDNISSPEKMLEARDLILKAMDALKLAWQPTVEVEDNGKSRQTRQGTRSTTR